MKRLILIMIILFCSSNIYSQGDLQFNRVVNETFTVSSSSVDGIDYAGSITIPDGKIWKISYVSYMHHSGGLLPHESFATIDDFIIQTRSSAGVNPVFPFWLPNGTFDVKFRYGASGGAQVILKISAIEFNVVPTS